MKNMVEIEKEEKQKGTKVFFKEFWMKQEKK